MAKQDLADLYRSDPVKALRLALRRTRGAATPELRMELINTLVNGCGVEALLGDWMNGYWGDVVGTYVNMGDTYSLTVVQKRTGSSRWDVSYQVTTWGDFVERNEKALGIR